MAKTTNTIIKRRQEFRERFGDDSYNAMVAIVKEASGRKVPSRIKVSKRSLASYRAHLTMGRYNGFITVKNGKVTDRMKLADVR